MRIIIAGAGSVGEALLSSLAERDENEVVVIDRDEARTDALAAAFDTLAIPGDATHPEVLEKAQIRQADALVATTGIDAVNVVIAMLARRFKVERVIVRLDSNALRAACEEVGVTGVVMPKLAAVTRMQSLLAGSSEVDFSFLTQGGIRLVELPTDGVKDRALRELELPDGALLISVVRDEEVVLPRGKTKLEENDSLIFLVESEWVLGSLKRALHLKD